MGIYGILVPQYTCADTSLYFVQFGGLLTGADTSLYFVQFAGFDYCALLYVLNASFFCRS